MKKWLLLATLILCAQTPISADVKILAISGSTREDSYNQKLLRAASEMAKQKGGVVTFVNLKDYSMPFYDGDLEKNEGMPANAKRLRKLMIESDGIIIASPEYNSSVSAVLKNALDWASRDESAKASREAFKGKKFAIMSASMGPGGGARALVHLRQIIENAGGTVVQNQVSVPTAQTAFNSEGNLQDSVLNKQLNQEIQQLVLPN